MYRIKISESTRRLVYSVAVVGLMAAALLFVAWINTTDASPAASNTAARHTVMAPAATFPANAGTLGATPVTATACTPTTFTKLGGHHHQ